MKRLRFKIIILALSLFLAFAAYSAVALLREFNFDSDLALEKWNKMILNGKVEYTLVKQGDNGFIEASSDKTCSALYYRIGFKLKDYPMLSWKWQVLEFPDKSKAVTEKERDDYAARVYVIFPFLNFSSSKFIEYIWAEDIAEGTILNSPDANNIKLIVARSGIAEAGQWLNESRDVYQDYIKAFGEKPNRGVGAVAIMCDADSTQSKAKASFDEIIIEAAGD